MDFLITLIGNAAVHPQFRELFLKDPVRIAERYGFRLTKGEYEIMTTVFAKLEDPERERLERAFLALEEELYRRLNIDTLAVLPPKKCMKPCAWSLWPPPDIREEMEQLGAAELRKANPRLQKRRA